ncbi:MAG: CDC27 family protein [Roseibium sp.]
MEKPVISAENDTSAPDPAGIAAALSDILTSGSFANADRLRNFLEYVVTEAIDGRGNGIRGKTIAQDVYGRNAATDGDPENVVRVDARRLRRRLADYYSSEGKDADVRIYIDSGGYTPRFEFPEDPVLTGGQLNSSNQPIPMVPVTRHRLMIGAVVAFFVVLALIEYFVLHDSEPRLAQKDETRILQRQALLEKSPATLEAANMAEQARGLTFPLFDVTRQKLSLGFFQQAIQIDPGYSGGYAGAAQTLGTLALLSPAGPQKTKLQSQSMEMAKKAIELDPTDPWTQSSASWAEYANLNFDEAVRLSTRAHALAPKDGNILEIYGTISLANGDFQVARDLSNLAISQQSKEDRQANRNILAVAYFFLGNYEDALNTLKIAAELGEPISPVVVSIQVSASHALGDMEQARRYASALQMTWPNVPIDKILLQMFRFPEHANEINRRLEDSGWQSPQGRDQ